MTRSSSCRELLEVGGWSLVSLYSQDPSGTTNLCWVRDEADCCLEWVTFSLLLKVSPEFLLGVQTACVGGGGWLQEIKLLMDKFSQVKCTGLISKAHGIAGRLEKQPSRGHD